jgi:hypothetical protein
MDKTEMDKTEAGLYFCSDPACVLHVCPGDPCVNGEGNWAVLPCGAMIGRGIYEGQYYCDCCGTNRITGRTVVSTRTPCGDSVERQEFKLEPAA